MQKDTEGAFLEAYARLNGAQKQAVDTTDGPVMVIAGPGTGKTQILTLRIAQILRTTDTQPENILALTFTEAGARAMRERLRLYIGSVAYRVPILTFHAFADQLIRTYPEHYDRLIGSRAATDIEKVHIIEGILAHGAYAHIRPLGDPIFYVPHIRSAIATMKREYISPDAFAEVVARMEADLALIPRVHEKGAHKGKVRGEYQKREKQLLRNKELALVYRTYESALRSERLYDFEDMILETVRACEAREDFLRELQETYQYILADEHQDVNGSQNRILDLLASYHEHPNIFVVGDEKQAIYRFQGASLENFLYFEERFPKTVTVALTENYRSGQTILDVAHSLIAVDEGPAQALRVPLHAATVGDSTVESRTFSHQGIEDAWVVDAVAERLRQGVPPEEIAIIVRTNREVEHYAALLAKADISAKVSSENNILEHPITATVRALMGAVIHSESEEALFRLLHGPYWGITPGDLVRLFGERSYTYPLARLIRDEAYLKDKGLHDPHAVLRVGAVIDTARSKEAVEAPHRVLEFLLTESGFLGALLKSDPLQGGAVVRRLYDEVERMVVRKDAVTLADVVKVFDSYEAYGIALTAPPIIAPEHAVALMTAHKSKGLEFAHVFIPHLTASGWGGKKRTDYFDIPLTHHLRSDAFDAYDDERRLLYVAITRAKEGVYMSSSEMNAEGREFLPSELLEELDSKLIRTVATDAVEQSFEPTAVLSTPAPQPILNPELLRSLFLGRGLSATALNNYLLSPWQYIYRNILRVPEAQPTRMLFGTALHNVMQSVSEHARRESALLNTTDISRLLERELGRLPITKEEFVTLHEKGLASLTVYLNEKGQSLMAPGREEFSIKVVLPTGNELLPEIPLTGKLDRLDFDADGTVVRVVDYKSGKPKTRGYIEGTTKDSTGDYKRQMVFYALLLSLYGDTRYQCPMGVLSFLEPDGKGAIHEEVFHITDAEIEELKAEIIRVAEEITSGACLHAPCDPKVSDYCDLAVYMMPKGS